ncbi:MAG: acetolactate synthase large subunit [Ectothiorhodospiraceae bacterium]|nr:acetolactate synthase large subunit [Ectothiorhodospiraceae bacterium]
MVGAETILRTLMNSGVDVCFANPGTSEMQFVAAVDRVPGMRPVLGLFEGVVAGAADGYARMADKPAATLFHLGPGLANGLANLHNAMRARSPIVNLVGDHATYHRPYASPLASDVAAYARPVSGWLRDNAEGRMLGADTRAAIAAAWEPPGQIATLLVPADCSWNPGGEPGAPVQRPSPRPAAPEGLERAIRALRAGERCLFLINGHSLRAEGLHLASRLAGHTGARFMADTFTARMERGAGLPVLQRFPRYPEQGVELLDGFDHLFLIETTPPVAFFAYPDQPSWLTPEHCLLHTLVEPGEDAVGALQALCEALNVPANAGRTAELSVPEPGTGALDPDSIAQTVASVLPEGAIVADEAITSRGSLPGMTAGCPTHDWLSLTGGALGQSLSAAAGAAIACPDRPVFCLQADGAGMYAPQALWTMVREGLNVTVLIYANRSYKILHNEWARLNLGQVGESARKLLDIGEPDLNWSHIARGMGMPAAQVTDAESLHRQLRTALEEPGPHLIEAIM